MSSEAVEILPGAGPVVLTCEHASLRLPDPWTWPDADRWLVGTHWSVDLGIAPLVRALSALTQWPAVLSRFSRLLVDANRIESSDTLFRTVAEGRPVQLNADLSEEEKKRRLNEMYHPYHAAVDAMVRNNPGALIFSLHSFTP
ncbi:MAG: N-formylglutamate amidohydrolase, partial [Myxococcota bacterium]